jgi:hypothetical protein
MFVTPPVAHAEIWPYFVSAAVRFEHQRDTASRIVLSLAMKIPSAENSGVAYSRPRQQWLAATSSSSTVPPMTNAADLRHSIADSGIPHRVVGLPPISGASPCAAAPHRQARRSSDMHRLLYTNCVGRGFCACSVINSAAETILRP